MSKFVSAGFSCTNESLDLFRENARFLVYIFDPKQNSLRINQDSIEEIKARFFQLENWFSNALIDNPRFSRSTGKSLSEALIFASTNPQYDDRLLIELQVQYKKIPSSNLPYSCLSNKRGAHAYRFWKIPPSTKKKSPLHVYWFHTYIPTSTFIPASTFSDLAIFASPPRLFQPPRLLCRLY